MKHVNMKWLLQNTICGVAALIISMTAMAGDTGGVPPAGKTPADFELKQVDKNKVQIACSMKAVGTEYYEIERSENNKDFTTVCVVFPAGPQDNMRNGIALKDKVNNAVHTFYYRLKKVTGDAVEYSAAKTIQLQ